MYIFKYSDKCKTNSCGFYIFVKLGICPTFSKSHWKNDFFKNHHKLGENKPQFEEKSDV